jgi:dipeptidyl aminopeptidase/acylaminoacyl peptidase
MSEMPVWERRFRAPVMSMPRWSRRAPHRTVFESNESGIWQVHCWDASTGERRQVSDHPVGVVEGYATPDGEGVIFWQEETGDETGRWLVQPFGGGDTVPLLEGVPIGWSAGISQAPGTVALGIDRRDGFAVCVSVDGGPAKEVARSTEWMAIGGTYQGACDIAGLSADGSLLAIAHSEHGDSLHPSLRVIDPRSGHTVADLHDEGKALLATSWSPEPGDNRLAVVHERYDWERPALWEPAIGGWTDVAIEMDGDFMVADWWPGASALLLKRTFEGRQELYRYDLGTGGASKIDAPPGHIADARVRPDGSVWMLHSDGVNRRRVLTDRGEEPIAVSESAPPGRPHTPWTYENDEGQRVHGWIVEPEGDGPHPVMLYVHGGPHWLYEDNYMPEVQAYVDAGFLVAMPNYRGSTGYGRAWRDALNQRVGFADVDDVTAGLRQLIATRNDVDPTRAVIAGWSWGGYVTLMEVGREPDLWRAAVAGVPVGDYVMAYDEEGPSLQAMDRALMGGTPQDVPDAYERSNPITYVDAVKAPVLFVMGENDIRCPLPQAMAYVDRLSERDHPHQVYLYATGHGSNATDEDVRQHRVILDFLQREVPGLNPI